MRNTLQSSPRISDTLTPVARSTSELTSDSTYRAGVIDLLGVLAIGELMAFERLASDASMAPSLLERVAIADMAAAELTNYRLLAERLESLGAVPHEAMAPFAAPLAEYHTMTVPSDWLEGLMKAYVGDGVAADFYREVASYLDPETAALVTEVCEDRGKADFAIDSVNRAIAADGRVAGRLALWGRRLMGEAMSQAQHVAAQREPLLELLLDEGGESGPNLAGLVELLGKLTANHADRMTRLGLAP